MTTISSVSNPKTPLLSIVMPTYNRAGTLLESAVQSILSQSFSDFELVIIDDASTDATKSSMEKFSDQRIRYHKTEKNHGEYWATNFGVNLCRGTYLTWIHSDDLLPDGSLQKRISTLIAHPDVDFVHGDIDKINENGTLIEHLPTVDWPKEKILSEYFKLPHERERRYLIHHTTVMMRWQFFYAAGPFDGSLPYAGDIDWLIRAIREGKYIRIPETLYLYRTHAGTRRLTDTANGIDPDLIHTQIVRRYQTHP